MSRYFAEHGAELFSVGIEVIPIVPRKKFPAIDGWQSMEVTEEVVDDWVSTRSPALPRSRCTTCAIRNIAAAAKQLCGR